MLRIDCKATEVPLRSKVAAAGARDLHAQPALLTGQRAGGFLISLQKSEQRAVSEPRRFTRMSPRLFVISPNRMDLSQFPVWKRIVRLQLDGVLEHWDGVFDPALHAKESSQRAIRLGLPRIPVNPRPLLGDG